MNVLAQYYGGGYGGAGSAIGGAIASFAVLWFVAAALPIVLFLVAALKCLGHREDVWRATGQQQVVWILVILLMPCLGPILYLAMAQTRITAWKRSQAPPVVTVPVAQPMAAVPASSLPYSEPVGFEESPTGPPVDFGAPAPAGETPYGPEKTVVVNPPEVESTGPGSCGQCGASLKPGSQFCRSCGARVGA